ncbi:MAG: terminase large subunit domain-containing protein [Plesiomonas shigelloides]
MQNLTRAEKLEMIALLEEKKRRDEVYRYRWFYGRLYGWQKDFVTKTSSHSQVCLMAANRVGKTWTGTYIDAIHAMGDYPDEWRGHRFSQPPLIWMLGYSADKLRDLLQTPLFGHLSDGCFSGGLIPPEMIVDVIPSGVPRLAKEVRVRHCSGGISRVQFWSYSQGQHALMGDSVDWYHIDEEPKDQTIFPQVLTRTAAGDCGNGGRGILTFTPENGRTDLVIQFMDNPSSAQIMMTVGWDDAPHLSDRVKEELLASFPPHQRDMRTKGIPMLGHGRIYDLSEEFITCEPFDIPAHWLTIGGMDFGYDHPQAQVKLIIDPDNDDIYLTNSWKESRLSANDAWGAVNKWQKGVPIAWPHDGLMHEKGRDDSKQQADHYKDAGFFMLHDRATWDGTSNSVEQGIYEIRDRMMKGKFKVLRGNRQFFDEFNQYHRDEKGRIVKTRDDILDAVRYAYMMRRYAKRVGDVGVNRPVHIPRPISPMRR